MMKTNRLGRNFLLSCLIWLFGISGFAYAANYTISIDSPSVTESGKLLFTISLNQVVQPGEDVYVDWATTVSGSATPGNDFNVKSGTEHFNESEDTKDFEIDTNSDRFRESDETVMISLTASCTPAISCSTSGAGTATGLILDDDYDVFITAAPSQSEGNSGTPNYTFTISIAPAIRAGETVEVRYRVQEDTADAPDDFTDIPDATLSFTNGTPGPFNVAVPINGDTDWEADETFIFELTDETNNIDLTTFPDSTIATIANDDTVDVQLTEADFTVDEKAGASSPTIYSVVIDQALVDTETLTVQYHTVSGSAVAGSDFVDTSGVLTFDEATGTSQTISIPGLIIDDPVREPTEQFTFELHSPSVNASISDGEVLTTIDDNDHDIEILAILSPVDEETGPAQFIIRAIPVIESGQSVVVNYEAMPGTAEVVNDFIATDGSIILSDVVNPYTVNVPIVNDSVFENDEVFTMEISTLENNATVTISSASMTITDNDYEISIANLEVDEDAGTADFVVSLDRALSVPDEVTVDYIILPGTALPGDDYLDVPGTVTFSGTTSTQIISIGIVDDDIAEIFETYQVQLSNPSVNATIIDDIADGGISDDDYTVSSYPDITVDEDVGTAQLTITLNRVVSGDPVIFDVTIPSGTALGGGVDYTNPPLTVSIPDGANSTTIDLPINDDTFVEHEETIVVQIDPSTSVTDNNVVIDGSSTPDNVATVTIAVDEIFSVSVNDPTPVEEAETIIPFIISVLPSPTSDDVLPDIFYNSTDGSAENGGAINSGDYDATGNQILTILDGQANYTIDIEINDDGEVEGVSEEFYLDLTGSSDPDVVTITDNRGVGTILDRPYVVTPSWSIHGTLTLDTSPPLTSIAISNGVTVGIPDNSDAIFTVTADYEISRVTIDGVDFPLGDASPPAAIAGYISKQAGFTSAVHIYTFLDSGTVPGAYTIDVEFDHAVTLTATGSGTITAPVSVTAPSGTVASDGAPIDVYADHGATETFAIAPAADNCVLDIIEDGASVGAFTGSVNTVDRTISSITDNRTLEAVFGTATITVLLGADDGLDNSDEDIFIQTAAQSGSGWRAYLTDASFDVSTGTFIKDGVHNETVSIPGDIGSCDARYIVIQYFDVEGYLKPANDQIDLNLIMNTNPTVEGLYDADSHVLELVFDHGTISVEPIGSTAVGDNRYIYTSDTSVTLTPTAETGWDFYGWRQDGSGTDNPLPVVMSSDKTIEAIFVQPCQDDDNDGYTVGAGTDTCSTSSLLDCDDTDPLINPGASEICGDGIDQNCSLPDVNDDACGAADTDGDGDGFTPNQGDCNDANGSVRPGAIDIPGNGIDEDCFDGDKRIGAEITCVAPSDIPANASRRPAPPLIMFLLDDSGSMDWEFMTSADNQLFNSRYYVYNYDGDSRAYGNSLLTATERRMWMSQWAGENRIFFNHSVTYDPWPMWDEVAASIPLAEYDGAEQMTVRTGENSYDSDNTSFPDRAFVDGFVHAHMDFPRNNTLDAEDGQSWSYIADDGTVGRHVLDLDGEFFRVKTSDEAQQVIVSRMWNSTGSTAADAIGLSVNDNLELLIPHNQAWYIANGGIPEVAVYDNLDGITIYSESNNWYDSAPPYENEWDGNLRWTDIVGQSATWRLNMSQAQADTCNAAGGCYVYAWTDEYSGRDIRARYSIYSYDLADNLVINNVREDQSPGSYPNTGRRWIRVSDSAYTFKEQTGASEVIVPNAHYFTWFDTDGDDRIDNGDGDLTDGFGEESEMFLITIPKTATGYELKYYRFNDLNSNERVDDGELVELTDPADYVDIKPVRFDEIGVEITDDDELAYVVRQNFADWYSFYRRRILTAKAAVGLTVADMDRVELGVHTINRSTHEPLQLMVTADGAEKIAYLAAIYNTNPNGSTPLRRGLHDVGQYFLEGNGGDAGDLQTREGLFGTDNSVFWDEDVDVDADDIDDSGGECQRAYVIAMTDGYYNGSFTIGGNMDGDSVDDVFALTDSTWNTLADIADEYYHTDLDTVLDNLVPPKGYDDAATQHLVTYGVSFGVFGQFDPDMFPDCLPACDTPGQNGCPQIETLGKVDNCITNAAGELECETCTDAATCSGTRTVGPFDNMCPDWHTTIGSQNPRSVDDLFHASVNGRGDFLNAADPAELVASLRAIKDLIEENEGTASSVSINANKIEANTLLFQTSYDSGDWSGDIEAKCLDSRGNVAPCAGVTCESSCNLGFETCLSLCTIGDTACEEVCLTARSNCYTTNNCDDFQTCSGAHTTCLDCIDHLGDPVNYPGCIGQIESSTLQCDQTRDDCLLDPPEVKWSASEQLASIIPDNRRIITADVTGGGLPFRWDAAPNGLTAAMRVLLGGESQQLSYLRGDRSCEESNIPVPGCPLPNYRARERLLGDFINSEPYYYKNEALGIDWVIAGANDGMLHIFNGVTGIEDAAYVPGTVFEHLTELTLPSYNDAHRFFVDGYVTTKDLGNTTLLVGGLGKGGKGFFGLDINEAKNGVDSNTFEANANVIVKWELNTMTIDAALSDHLGYSYSRPQIIRSNSSEAGAEWLFVFGNGYDSVSGHAVLFLVGLDSSGNIVWTRAIDTGVGDTGPNCNGLSSPAIIFPQGDGTNDFIFAGDLLGNMWKFDISSSNRADWDVYFKDGSDVNQPLFTAKNNFGHRQPITMQPDVTISCVLGTEGYLVAFGTGRLYNPEIDNLDDSIQSMYGIWDWSAEWEAQGGSGPLTYLGEFTPANGSVTAACQATCTNIQNDCEFACLGNSECELECAEERLSCSSNCSSVRTLSNMGMILANDPLAPAAQYVALLQQSQVSVNGIVYNPDGTIGSQEYGVVNLNEVDEVVRTVSDNVMDWMLPTEVPAFIAETNKTIRHVGWYYDLPGNRERAIKDVIIASGKLIYTTSTPSDTPCAGGGTSSIWVVDVCSGGRTSRAYFDLNGDGFINFSDYINIGTAADPVYVAPSSIMVEGISPAPTLVEVEQNIDRLYFPDNQEDSGLSGLGTQGYGVPILYWRELDWQ